MKSKHAHHYLCDSPNGGAIAGRCACGKRRRFPASGFEGLNPPRNRTHGRIFAKLKPQPVGETDA